VHVSVEDELPNLVPDAPILSSQEGTTKFLDYLDTKSEGTDCRGTFQDVCKG